MNQDKIAEILKNYRSYRYAYSNGIAAWSPYDNTGMPFSGGYGSRAPTMGTGTLLPSIMDRQRYGRVVQAVDGAVNEVLNDDQRIVIQRKYLDRNKQTLLQISNELRCDPSTTTRWHKEALKQLSIALEFLEVADIINLDTVLHTA